jgi:hypothetical protein
VNANDSGGPTLFRHGIEPFAIGRDSISPANASYNDTGSFPFTGTIEKIQFAVSQKPGAGNLEKLRRIDTVLRDAV